MLTRDYEAPNRLPYSAPSYSSLSHSREGSAASPFMTALPPDLNSALDSASLLGALVEALPKGLIVLSTDRAIVYWNQTARQLCQKLSGSAALLDDAAHDRNGTVWANGRSKNCP